MLKVYIPKKFKKTTMHLLIDEVIDSDMMPKSKEIRFDFSRLSFIEPSGVTILSNLLEWLMIRGVNVSLTGPKEMTTALKFLDDSMFFKHYLKTTFSDHAAIRPTTSPLNIVSYDESFSYLDKTLLPYLSNMLSVNVKALGDIKTSFGEIFNNIRDHANEKCGCIFAQRYPQRDPDEIVISVSDFGVGIPETIRRVHPSLDDSEALVHAIVEGVSSKSTPRNRGAGLRTLVHNVVLNNGGRIEIRSFYGILNISRNTSGDLEVNSLRSVNRYPGTFMEITLDTNKFVREDVEEEEFEWDF
ncbi:ATP-binding protein [Terribacillus halophilus]|uniref:ATP-binding protein n=1 Tax=Terribacillus halophilus TaxID=361279 RepID=UPI003982AF7B